jgi:hypothetical protein
VSVHVWTPGTAGPLDELVGRITRIAGAFAQEHGLAQAEVRIELFDGSRYLLAGAMPEPGFGFFSFDPHPENGQEPRRMIVPIGAVKTIEISAPDDPTRQFGFSAAD